MMLLQCVHPSTEGGLATNASSDQDDPGPDGFYSARPPMSTLSIPNLFATRNRARDSFRHKRLNRWSRRPQVEGLEDRITLASDVWTGQAAFLVNDMNW